MTRRILEGIALGLATLGIAGSVAFSIGYVTKEQVIPRQFYDGEITREVAEVREERADKLTRYGSGAFLGSLGLISGVGILHNLKKKRGEY